MGSVARVTSAAEGLPRRRFTVAEVEAMVAAGVMEEDERVELIGGELVPMSPKGSHHEVLKAALLRRWYRAAPDEVDLVPETTFRLLTPASSSFTTACAADSSCAMTSAVSKNPLVPLFASEAFALRLDAGTELALFSRLLLELHHIVQGGVGGLSA
jgi:hypothetical protein